MRRSLNGGVNRGEERGERKRGLMCLAGKMLGDGE